MVEKLKPESEEERTRLLQEAERLIESTLARN
jgi:hypothetical protein